METAVNRFQSVAQTIAHPTPAQADLLSQLYAAQAGLNEKISNYDEAIAAAKEAIQWGEIGQNDKNQAAVYQQWGVKLRRLKLNQIDAWVTQIVGCIFCGKKIKGNMCL